MTLALLLHRTRNWSRNRDVTLMNDYAHVIVQVVTAYLSPFGLTDEEKKMSPWIAEQIVLISTVILSC